MMVYLKDGSCEWIDETKKESILRIVEEHCGSEISKLIENFFFDQEDDSYLLADLKKSIRQWINVLELIEVGERDKNIFKDIIREMGEDATQ